MSSINHIVEPQRLLLSWQAIEVPVRSRFLVGEIVRGEGATFRYFPESEDYRRAKEAGFGGYPAFRVSNGGAEFNGNVLEAFLRRLPPRSREDYGDYLRQYGLSKCQTLSDIALLGYLRAKLPGDGFELVHTFEEAGDDPFEFILEVAGFQHSSKVDFDTIDDSANVSFHCEPENPSDPQAIEIRWDNRKVGYVDRVRTMIFHRLFEERRSFNASIYMRNGTTSRPLLYLFIEVGAGHSSIRGQTR